MARPNVSLEDLELPAQQTLIVKPSQDAQVITPATLADLEHSALQTPNAISSNQDAVLTATEMQDVFQAETACLVPMIMIVKTSQLAETAEPAAPVEAEHIVLQLLIVRTWLQSVILIHVLELLNVSQEDLALHALQLLTALCLRHAQALTVIAQAPTANVLELIVFVSVLTAIVLDLTVLVLATTARALVMTVLAKDQTALAMVLTVNV